MTDTLAKLRASVPVRDRKDRAEATGSPDARKARDIVKAVASESEGGIHVTLVEIARRIARVTADPGVRDLLLDRADAFEKARVLYLREEGQVDRPIVWLGGGVTGVFPGGPTPGMASHRVLAIVAWGALLRVVNEATKVGVQKLNRYKPISLQVDLDAMN